MDTPGPPRGTAPTARAALACGPAQPSSGGRLGNVERRCTRAGACGSPGTQRRTQRMARIACAHGSAARQSSHASEGTPVRHRYVRVQRVHSACTARAMQASRTSSATGANGSHAQPQRTAQPYLHWPRGPDHRACLPQLAAAVDLLCALRHGGLHAFRRLYTPSGPFDSPSPREQLQQAFAAPRPDPCAAGPLSVQTEHAVPPRYHALRDSVPRELPSVSPPPCGLHSLLLESAARAAR